MGPPLINARMPPGLMMGFSLNDGAPGVGVANVGLMGARFTEPRVESDSLYRAPRSRPYASILGFRHSASPQAFLKLRHSEV